MFLLFSFNRYDNFMKKNNWNLEKKMQIYIFYK